ncbi:hypothetical protein [Nocardioides limicola]|uniref:hypothetical protein n=1 Tax=Nocardioides limicola TaxID=2803368 RepID=UPI00193B399F|nr:hypothetical protein [Nocardioides sp. DJM-14]
MNKGRWIAVIVAGAVAAMALGPQGPLGGFWGAEPAGDVGITGALAGGFIAYGLIEGAGFGAGLAWLAFGRPLLGRGADATAAYLSIGWLLASGGRTVRCTSRSVTTTTARCSGSSTRSTQR